MTFPLSSTHHRAGARGGHKIWGKSPPPPLWRFTGHMTQQGKTLMKTQKIHVGNTVLPLQRWSKSSPTAFAQKYMPSKTKRHHLLVLPERETKWWSQKRCFPPKTRALPGSAPSPRQSFLKAYLKKTLTSLGKLFIIQIFNTQYVISNVIIFEIFKKTTLCYKQLFPYSLLQTPQRPLLAFWILMVFDVSTQGNTTPLDELSVYSKKNFFF